MLVMLVDMDKDMDKDKDIYYTTLRIGYIPKDSR